MRFYAGVGSRKTPMLALTAMSCFAILFREQGLILRSGNARGADEAFERYAWGSCDIIKPPESYSHPEWYGVAASVHPAWGKCNEFARAAHARNAAIILGRDLATPVDFVVCWTADGETVGGTATAIRIAQSRNIPVYNLGKAIPA